MDHQHSSEENGAHGFTRQRKPKSEPLCCPICGVTLRTAEIDQHFALEVERLDRILKPRKNHHCTTTGGYGMGADTTSPEPGTSGTRSGGGTSNVGTGLANGHRSLEENGEPSSGKSSNPDECWGTYQKIKNNRQARLKMKTRKRKPEDNVCPVCNKSVLEEITTHVEACLRKNETNGSCGNGRTNESDDDDASIDVEGESYEVYEWAGQTRVRATTMLNQSGAFPSTAVRVTNADDTDDELNVDGDETQIYGPPQYSERDVVYPLAEQRCKDSYLRGLVMANEPITVKRPEVDNPGEGPSWGNTPSIIAGQPMDNEQSNGESTEQIVNSLKSKIREYEGYIKNRPKCLICMDDFKKPVVSICCWHVYCQECWLHTLGAKKLCPQCSMITSPTDLRRIYL